MPDTGKILKDVGKNVGKTAGKAAGTVSKAAGSVAASGPGKAVGGAATTAGKAVGDAAVTAGKAVGGAAVTAGKAVGDVATSAGKAVARALPTSSSPEEGSPIDQCRVQERRVQERRVQELRLEEHDDRQASGPEAGCTEAGGVEVRERCRDHEVHGRQAHHDEVDPDDEPHHRARSDRGSRLAPDRLAGGERGEEVDPVAIGIMEGRVALSPERIPRFPVALVACADKIGVGAVHLGRTVADEGETDALAAARRRPLRIE